MDMRTIFKRHKTVVPVATVTVSAQNAAETVMQTQWRVEEHSAGLERLDTILKSEQYILSRQIHRCGSGFRAAKFLARMRQLNRLLLRYGEEGLTDSVMQMRDLLRDSGLDEMKNLIHIPSRLLCRQLLCGILRSAKVLQQAIHFCFEFKRHIHERICLEQYVLVMLFYWALASRIWIICRTVLKMLIDIYDTFNDFMTKCFPANRAEETDDVSAIRLPADIKHLFPHEAPVDVTSTPQSDDILANYDLSEFGVIAPPSLRVRAKKTRKSQPKIPTILQQFYSGDSQQNLNVLDLNSANLNIIENNEVDLGIAIKRTEKIDENLPSDKTKNALVNMPNIATNFSVQKSSNVHFTTKHPIKKAVRKNMKLSKTTHNVDVPSKSPNENVAAKNMNIKPKKVKKRKKAEREVEKTESELKNMTKRKHEKDSTVNVLTIECTQSVKVHVNSTNKVHASSQHVAEKRKKKKLKRKADVPTSDAITSPSTSEAHKKIKKSKKLEEKSNIGTNDVTFTVPALIQGAHKKIKKCKKKLKNSQTKDAMHSNRISDSNLKLLQDDQQTRTVGASPQLAQARCENKTNKKLKKEKKFANNSDQITNTTFPLNVPFTNKKQTIKTNTQSSNKGGATVLNHMHASSKATKRKRKRKGVTL